jgi:hypothetical protein
MTSTVDTTRVINKRVSYRNTENITVGLMSIDVDPAATRLHLVERITGSLIATRLIDSDVVNVVVPLKYSFDPILYAIIFDDLSTFNAAVQDNCIAEIVSIDTLSPYESL